MPDENWIDCMFIFCRDIDLEKITTSGFYPMTYLFLNISALFNCSVKKTRYEPPHDKTNKMACASSEDSDQPGNPPSLIGVFAVRMNKAWVLSYPLIAQRRLWSDWADAQADLSLRWAHSHFVGFVRSRLICQTVIVAKRLLNKSIMIKIFSILFYHLRKGQVIVYHF